MVSIVSPGVTHVSTEYVTDLTEGVNMVASEQACSFISSHKASHLDHLLILYRGFNKNQKTQNTFFSARYPYVWSSCERRYVLSNTRRDARS